MDLQTTGADVPCVRYIVFFTYVRSPKVFQTPGVACPAAPRALKALHPNARVEGDNPTPEDLLDPIEAHGREVAEALGALRAMSRPGPAVIQDGEPRGRAWGPMGVVVPEARCCMIRA